MYLETENYKYIFYNYIVFYMSLLKLKIFVHNDEQFLMAYQKKLWKKTGL